MFIHTDEDFLSYETVAQGLGFICLDGQLNGLKKKILGTLDEDFQQFFNLWSNLWRIEFEDHIAVITTL